MQEYNGMAKHTFYDLHQMQSLSLSAKVEMSRRRIVEWYDAFDGKVYVSFSGGKDSLVLLHLVRSVYSEVSAVFIDTGLEHPSVKKFALSHKNVVRIRPEMSFKEVLTIFGYPIVSKEIARKVRRYRQRDSGCKDLKDIEAFQNSFVYKSFEGLNFRKDGKRSAFNCRHYRFLLGAPFKVSEKCCDAMKKWPTALYEETAKKKPFLAIRASESRDREMAWRQQGCNAFHGARPNSKPLAFWTEQDVFQYLYENNLQLAESYGEVKKDEQTCKFHTTGCSRTGCMFCLFGIKYDKERVARLQAEDSILADYVLRGGEFSEDGYWQPSVDGLGLWFVIEWLNRHGMGIHYKNAQRYVERYSDAYARQLLQ